MPVADHRDNAQLMRPRLWVIAGAGVLAGIGAVVAGGAPAAGPPDRARRRAHAGGGRIAAGQRPGLVARAAGEPARSGHGADRRSPGSPPSSARRSGPVAVHDRHRRPVRCGSSGFLYLLLSFPSGRLHGRLDRCADGGRAGRLLVPASSWRCCTATRRGCGAPAARTTCCRSSTTTTRRIDCSTSSACSALVTLTDVIAVLDPALAAGQRGAAPRGRAGARGGVRHARGALAATVALDLVRRSARARCPRTSFFYLDRRPVPIAVLFVFLQRRLARGAVAGLVVELGEPSAARRPARRRSRARSATRRSSSPSGFRPRRATSTATARPVELPEDDTGAHARRSSSATASRSRS